mgnify:CR=1 FL=1
MRAIYILTLFLGLCMAVLFQLVTVALPRDAYVAAVLARHPDQWGIQLDDELASRLSHHDVQVDTAIALQHRSQVTSDTARKSFSAGLGIIAFSVVGLVRERKIRQFQNAGPQRGATDASRRGPHPESRP